jgi:tRNA(Ile)-lysidine synthase TilS/MesJ
MELQDEILNCVDCGAGFKFTGEEQLFFHDEQLKNEPKRCKACKTKRMQSLGVSATQGGYPKVVTDGKLDSAEEVLRWSKQKDFVEWVLETLERQTRLKGSSTSVDNGNAGSINAELKE